MGPPFYDTMLLIGARLCLILFALFNLHSWFGWLFILAVPVLYRHAMYVLHQPTTIAMRPMLEQIIKGALLTNLLFASSVVLS